MQEWANWIRLGWCYILEEHFLYIMFCRLNLQRPFCQAAVEEGEAPAGLPVKKSGTAPTQTEVMTVDYSQTSLLSWIVCCFWRVLHGVKKNILFLWLRRSTVEMFLLGRGKRICGFRSAFTVILTFIDMDDHKEILYPEESFIGYLLAIRSVDSVLSPSSFYVHQLLTPSGKGRGERKGHRCTCWWIVGEEERKDTEDF